MSTQQNNVPNMVQNPVNGKYINIMPFFQFTAEIATCTEISSYMEEAIDWLACTPIDQHCIDKGSKEAIAYRLIQLKQLFRQIGELQITAKVREA